MHSGRGAHAQRAKSLLVLAIAAALLSPCSSFLGGGLPLPGAIRGGACERAVRSSSLQHIAPLRHSFFTRVRSEQQGGGAVGACMEAGRGRGRSVVVVGGGWAGFGAARHLSQQGYNVSLIDAAANPGGLATAFKTSSGKTVEAGIKGFWRQYKNIFRLTDELRLHNTFTDWQPSSFWSERGLEVDAPVLGRAGRRLPTPLGQFVYTLPRFAKLSVRDRLSIARLFYSVIDSMDSYERYDRMSIHDVLMANGVSGDLYRRFLRPLIMATLFAPPEQLSAAVAIGSFYNMAMASQEAYDVRWCRGAVSDRIFAPLVADFEKNGGTVYAGTALADLELGGKGAGVTRVLAQRNGDTLTFEADAVILSVGAGSLKHLLAGLPCLAERAEIQASATLQSSDCIAVRLWFDKRVPTRSPANVLAEALPNVGAAFWHLNDLHDELRAPEVGSVIAFDLYHAASAFSLSDETLVKKLHDRLGELQPGYKGADIVDYAVIRAPQCATLFSPGSLQCRPTQNTSIPNFFLAGDYVRGGEAQEHGAAGPSQERALITGYAAANLVVQLLGRGHTKQIIGSDKDEWHVTAARVLNRAAKERHLPDLSQARMPYGLPSPFPPWDAWLRG